jgi:hypothetical protein
MEREYDTVADIHDLGAASAETKGADGIFTDDVLKRPLPGLSND